MPTFNDLNLKNWQNSEIITDSLWLIPERNKSGKHSNFYHGNFIPQIPHQFILRYTKKDDVVLDPFVGSGTTAFEAERLKRNFIGIDLQAKLINEIKKKIDTKDNFIELIAGDSVDKQTFKKVKEILKKHNRQKIQLAILSAQPKFLTREWVAG